MSVALLLLAAVLVSACGGDASPRDAMDAKFEQIDYEMGNMENLNSAFSSELAKATQRYIVLIREYADVLGPAEAKRRLAQKEDEVAPYCLPCTAPLADEARKC